MSAVDLTAYRELAATEDAIRTQLSDASAKVREEKLRLIKLMFGIEVGTVVVMEKTGKSARVASIRVGYWSPTTRLDGKVSPPDIQVNLEKKDGTFSSAERNAMFMFDPWSVPDFVSPEMPAP